MNLFFIFDSSDGKDVLAAAAASAAAAKSKHVSGGGGGGGYDPRQRPPPSHHSGRSPQQANPHSKPRRPPGSPPSPILKYMKIRVRNLFHVPLSILNKSACVLEDQLFIDVLPDAWELLK